MVAPLVALALGGMAIGAIGSQFGNHYNRQSLYNQKKLYDMEYNAIQARKAQYMKNVGKPVKNPMGYDYQLQRNRLGYQNVEYGIKSNWAHSVAGAGYSLTGMAGAGMSYGGNSYRPSYDSFNGAMYGDYSAKSLYGVRSGKRWL